MKTKMKNEDSIGTWETSEFGLSSYLLAKHILLLGIKQSSDPRRKLFIFEETDKIAPLIHEFWAGKGTVEPMQFLSAQRELKSLLHSDSYAVSYTKGGQQ